MNKKLEPDRKNLNFETEELEEAVEERTWIKVDYKAITNTIICLTLSIVFPLILAHTPQNQFIVGPIVNGILFWAAYRLGITNAIFIGLVPSSIALFRGMLPPTMVFLIPFIIIGNAALVLSFAHMKGNLLKRVIFSSFVKTLFIFFPLLIGIEVLPIVKFMMSWPQFVTALAGGVLFILFDKYHRRIIKIFK